MSNFTPIVVAEACPDPPAVQRTTHYNTRSVSFERDRRGCCAWLGNILWILVGGWHLFAAWCIVGIVLCMTCVGIPCGMQCFKIAGFLLFPFGKSVAYVDDQDPACGCNRTCNCFLNILWAVTVGWILALQAFVTGVLLCITICGIPLAIPCFQSMILCIAPFGVEVTATERITESYTTTTTTVEPAHYQAL
mmetsp:Transcript_112409/g.168245  ORF Transcript_112409/g.168245 Transcript_112409/m.168245 type:complete len:192 (-) Transcript_112409:93-668(-)